MDDILRKIDYSDVNEKLNEINDLHPSSHFTIKLERHVDTIS